MFLEKDMQFILEKGHQCSWKRTGMPLEKGYVQLECTSSFGRKNVAAAAAAAAG